MALGISLAVTAAGAILRYAYTPTSSHGFNFATTGAILMIIGIIGTVLSIVAWVSSSYRHQRTTSTTEANGQVLRRDDVDTRSSI
jgi:heme/copper-type cytochrome/quinol oxidase subunit 2